MEADCFGCSQNETIEKNSATAAAMQHHRKASALQGTRSIFHRFEIVVNKK
jgi:hypothetical protein